MADHCNLTAEKKDVSGTECLKEFASVCEEREANDLPPEREYDLEINLKDDKLTPPFLKIYALSKFEEDHLKEWIDNGLKKGFLRPSNSPYAAPIFFVKKKNGKLRPCIDYRQLNQNTVKDGHPIPLIADVLAKFKESKVFSSIDLRGAYNLIRMKKGHEYKASFRCKFGQFEPTVVQFGLTNAPAVFSRFVLSIFRDLVDIYLEVYIDDIIVYSNTLEEHVLHLKAVFKRLQEHQLVISLEKCLFFTEELVYLGYKITTRGISMEADKIKAILDFGAPRNVKEVRSFVGLINYYRKFIKNFSYLALPLTALTKKGLEFKWTEVEEMAFTKLKLAVRDDVMLRYPDSSRPFYISADASDYALGSVLSQRDEEENLRPVEFYSRKFLPAEQNYTVYDKELLAIVESFKVWRHFLLYSPHRVEVKSDHNNLKYFATARLYKPRHARWAEELSQYDFIISHVSGVENSVADALSRDPKLMSTCSPQCEMVLLKDSVFRIAALGSNDPEQEPAESGAQDGVHDWPEDIAKYMVSGEWDCSTHSLKKYKPFMGKFKIMGDKLYYLTPLGWPRAYVPFSQRSEIMARFHDQLGHLGAESILDLVTRRYYWPNLESDLRKYCTSCSSCQLARSRGGAPKPILKPIPPVALPFERLGLDFVGILTETKKGNRWSITAVDYATRWAWAVPVKEATSATVIWFLYHYIICFVGCPSEVITDKGRNFISQEMQDYFSANKIKHLETSPYHPATNGMVERMHGMLNHGISALCASRVDRWDEYIDEVLCGIRVRTHSVTGFSPFYLLFGVHPRLAGDVSPPGSILEPLDDVERRVELEGWTNRELESLGAARGQAYLRTQASKAQVLNEEEFYFKRDDWVKIKNYQKKKFQFTWKGPYIVHGYGYFPTYWLRDPNGEFLKNVVNQANMAPWTSRVVDNEDYWYGFAQEDVDQDSDSQEDGSRAFPEEGDDVDGMDGYGSESGSSESG